MAHRIRVLGTALELFQGPLRYWLAWADPEKGTVRLTVVPSEAKVFSSPVEALEFWRRQSTRRPLRPDGQPNRPLTAYTIEIEEAA